MKQVAKKIIGLIVLCIFGWYALSWLFVITEKDRNKWEELKKKTTIKEQTDLIFTVKKKDCIRELYKENEPQIYLQINSDYSQFIIQKKTPDIEIEELFYGVQAILQEDCYYVDETGKKTEEKKNPMQKVRVLQADEALLNLQKNTLTATNVHMQSYILPNHTLPQIFDNEPFLQADADQITLFLQKGHSKIECDQFHSNFQINELLQ